MATMNLNSLFAEYKRDPSTGLDPLLEAIRKRAVRFLGNEDSAQDFLVEVWKLLPGLEIHTSFLAWLTIRMRWRNADNHGDLIEEAKWTEQIPAMYDENDELLTDSEAADALLYQQMVKSGEVDPPYFDQNRLDAIEDQTIRLVAELMLQGYTTDEISERLSMRPAALRKRIQRFRDRDSLPLAA